ncbi:malto-oligosyltrehalose trehalohydrolase, partial [Pseudomonas syringae pv. tagetis]
PLRSDDNWRHGAVLLEPEHTRFALWAPDASYVNVELQDGQSLAILPQPERRIVIEARCEDGARNRFRIDQELEVPYPASRA